MSTAGNGEGVVGQYNASQEIDPYVANPELVDVISELIATGYARPIKGQGEGEEKTRLIGGYS